MANQVDYKYSSQDAITAFDEYFSRAGYAIFDYELHSLMRYRIPHEAGYMMLEEYCISSGIPSAGANTVIGFIDDPQFQALAAKEGDFHFIAISAAVPALLRSIFQVVFRLESSAFSNCQVKKHKLADELMFPITLNHPYLKGAYHERINELFELTLPEEKWQRQMAASLSEIAIVFCILHELGHIGMGHTALIEKRGFSSYSELPNISLNVKRKRAVGKWLSQVWELDADLLGLELLYYYAIDVPQNRRRLMRQLRCKDVLDLASRVIYSIQILFLLISQSKFDLKAGGTHPSPAIRISHIVWHFATKLHERERLPEALAISKMMKYCDFALTTWRTIGFGSGAFNGPFEDFAEVVKDYSRAREIAFRMFSKYRWHSKK
jgi:hypothetical protein